MSAQPPPARTWTASYDNVQFDFPALSERYHKANRSDDSDDSGESSQMLQTPRNITNVRREVPVQEQKKSGYDLPQGPSVAYAAQNAPPLPGPSRSQTLPYIPHPNSFHTEAENGPGRPPARRSPSSRSFTPSPLNPSGKSPTPPHPQSGSRLSSYSATASSPYDRRTPPDGVPSIPSSGSRGSMILYRLASDDFGALQRPSLLPHHSGGSTGGDSMVSLITDSNKYPIAHHLNKERGFVPYEYDPFMDLDNDPELDALHDPKLVSKHDRDSPWSARGIITVTMLVSLVAALLSLFIVYPILLFSHDTGKAERIAQNPHINSSGQAVDGEVPVGRRNFGVWSIPEPQADAQPPDAFAPLIPI